MNLTLILPHLILTGLGLVLVLVGVFTKDKSVVGRVGFVGALIALLALIPGFGRTEQIWGNMLLVDGFSSLFGVIFLSTFGLVILTSQEYVKKRAIQAGEFFTLLSFATLGALLMAGSLDMITIYLGLETMSISAYVLAGMLREDPRSSEASIKFFLIGAVASALTLYGMSLVYGMTGTTHLGDIGVLLGDGSSMGGVLTAGLLLMLVGLGVKVAIVPFHMWAPDVYEGAPTPISAFLITASEAAGFAALLRILMVGLPALHGTWTMIFAVLAAVTMTFGNITAIVQTQVKRLMAYSAIAQAGYVLVGLAVGTQASVSAMLYYILGYAFMTIGAFAVIIMLSNHIPSERVADFKGLSQRAPFFSMALVIYLLSLIGVPPTVGFLGKLRLFQATIDANMTWLAVIMVLNSVISVPYYFSIVRNMYLGESEETTPLTIGGSLRLAVGVTVIATLALGIWADPVLKAVAAIHVLPGL